MPNVLIAGHSFVRRYHDYLIRKNGLQINYNNCLGLPCENIYIIGKGALKTDEEGLNLVIAKAKQVKPDVVLLEIGTNDLAVTTSDKTKQVTQTLSDLYQICEQLFTLGVKRVILCEVIARRRFRGKTTQAEFDFKQRIFNSALHFLSQINEDILIWRHERSKIRNLKESEISSDNIHITTELGLQLYNFSIRAAIIKGLKTL